jgi:superfamily II DNA helicase RecQ
MEFFNYEPELRVLTCQDCKTTVIGCRIKPHLGKAPHRLKLADIKPAQEWASKLDIVWEAKDICDIPTPDEFGPAIKGLGPVNTGGFRCELETGCTFVGSEPKRIWEHYREFHRWEPDTKAGRPPATLSENGVPSMPWRSGVRYQRLFTKGPRSNYFEVERGWAAAVEEVTDEDQRNRETQQALLAFRSKTAQVRQQEAEKIDEQHDVGPPNPWLRRLGAARHLKDFTGKKEFLLHLVSLERNVEAGETINEDDDALRHIHAAIRRIVRRGRAVARAEVVSWNALFEVNRTDLHKERSRPFHFLHMKETIKAYTKVCIQLFTYLVRTMTFELAKDRPPFVLSERQKAACDTMMDYADRLTDMEAEHGRTTERPGLRQLYSDLDGAVTEMYMSILDHYTKATEYDSILVSFIMVLSVRPDKTWETFVNLTPKLSAIMAISRLFIVKYAVDKRKSLIEGKIEGGMTREKAEEHSPSHFELISDMTRRFMVGGGEGWQTTPTQFIVRLRNYGISAAQNDAKQGSVSWDGEDAIYKGIRTSVVGIQSMLQTALQRAEEVLFKELLFFNTYHGGTAQDELDIPTIPWDKIIDNAADATIGYSLVNQLLELDKTSDGWAMKKIMSSDLLRREWIQVDGAVQGRIRLCPKKTAQYGMAVERVLELLLFLVHIAYGQPARGPEVLTIRHRNTANGGIRNLIMDRGLLMIVMGYHKGFSRSERLKVIQRFLPREITRPFVYFLWLVLPFWEDLQVNVLGKEELSPSVWATEDMLANEGGGDESDSDGYSSGSREVHPSQGRRRKTTKTKGSRKKESWQLGSGTHWTSPRMSRILKRNSLVGCEQGFTISSWRHLSAAIARRYFRTATTGQASFTDQVDEGYGSESDGEDTEDSSPWDTQAGHESLTAGLVYGRLIMEGSFETNERRLNFRHISEEWHRLLGFRSAMGVFGDVLRPGHKRKNPSIHHEALRELQLARWKTLRRVDIDRELCRLYGQGARFRGKQRQAVASIMQNKSPIFVVMGTGQGKSLCFMLPAASCAGGITLVVVPLVSLLGDMMVRCEQLGIASAEWRTDRAPGNVSVVFVTPESALTKRFLDYVEALRVTARLDRVVIDECHTVLEGTPAFRPRLRELGRLALVGVQMVFLTATLPPLREADLFKLTNTRPEDVEMIRMKTTRKNVAYSVVSVPLGGGGQDGDERMTTAVLATVKEKLEEHAWPAKIIVYTQRVEATAQLAERLGCDAYHREVDTRDGKAERLRIWRQGIRRDQPGEGRVIVATNALGLGIDVADIRVVIHVGMPRSMEEYAQQSGRAGRDGERSEAIVLSIDLGSRKWRDKVLVWENGTVDDYMGGRTCRRVVMDYMMDGRNDRTSCEAGEEMCDVCVVGEDDTDSLLEEGEEERDLRQRETMVDMIRGRAIDRAAQEQLELVRFRERLEKQLAAGCIFCASKNIGDRHHSALECKAAPKMETRKADIHRIAVRMGQFMRRAGVVERFGCCQGCLAPQELCNGWEENKEEGGWRKREGVECQYRGVMISVVAWVEYALKASSERLYQRLGFERGEAVDGIDDKKLWTWLGRRSTWGQLPVSNICRVYYFMAAEEGEDGADYVEAWDVPAGRD